MKKRFTEKELENIITIIRLINSENNLVRNSLEKEQQWLQRISEGKFKEVSFIDYNELMPHMGKSTNSHKKLIEYCTVAGIALAARAAISGGLSPESAFDISDVMLLNLEQAATVDEMHEIIVLTGKLLAREVHKCRRKETPYIVEQSKIYINKHIFEKIQLKNIADYAGVHPVYLSRLFSQTEKITISEYIQREKMNVACNLLTYSDRSIAEIVQYMGIQSQSNFSSVFRKWIHMSPSEYRNKNKTNVFC